MSQWSADGAPEGSNHHFHYASWFATIILALVSDPKDGELCLNRAKPGETLVEARSDSDVQIDRQIWV